jgi:dTDP-4-dehydrorhamnose 3,5-epimerase-like enzyme
VIRELSVKPFIDSRGALCVWEPPHAIARAYFLYGTPDHIHRGDHAHRKLERTLIAVAGAVDLTVDDGKRLISVRLDDPAKGVYVPPMVWTDLHNFSADAVVLCLASLPYDEADYIRDRKAFLAELQ